MTLSYSLLASSFYSAPTLKPPFWPEVLNESLLFWSPSHDLSQTSPPFFSKSMTDEGANPKDFPLTLYQKPFPSPLTASLTLSVYLSADWQLSESYKTILDWPFLLAPTKICVVFEHFDKISSRSSSVKGLLKGAEDSFSNPAEVTLFSSIGPEGELATSWSSLTYLAFLSKMTLSNNFDFCKFKVSPDLEPPDFKFQDNLNLF
jgi:hypothetical protein